MTVPVWADLFSGGVFRSAVKLYKAYPPFRKSTGEQALTTEGTNVWMIQFVKFFYGFGFSFDISDFGCT